MSHAYSQAGVDIAAGDAAVELMKAHVRATHGPLVVPGGGGFAGLVDVSALARYRKPLLAMSTDGVGTKVELAARLGIHDTIGFDMVAMVVDDLAVCGAQPLALTDYIACGKVVPDRIAAIVAGIAKACQFAGVPLVGGETAEHPGHLGTDQYDLSGTAVGVVEADHLLGPHRVCAGDKIIAMAASGLHSNGYSLVRRIVANACWDLSAYHPDFGRTLGEELLEPTRIYTPVCLQLARVLGDSLRVFSHVTGGGLGANLARVIPAGCVATVDRGSWQVPVVFQVLREAGSVSWADLEDTLNLGVGMVAVVAPTAYGPTQEVLTAAGIESWPLGTVTQCNEGDGPTVAERKAGQPRSRLFQGTKGVSGGAVVMQGSYR